MPDEIDAALRASRAMLGIVARTVSPALEQMSLPHFRVLVLLETGGPARVGALAAKLDVVVSTFSRSLDRLEAAGWVERNQSESHRREVVVSITNAGGNLVREVSAARSAAFSSVLAAAGATEREAIALAFTAFADAAGEPDLKDLLVLGM